MTNSEFKERKAKMQKCLFCVNFFGTGLCYFYNDKVKITENPFKIKAPLCLDINICPKENKKEIKEMAKNFGKVNNKTFESVAKLSEEKAQVITVKMIPNDKLNDYPNNREDVIDTLDLEHSIKQLGFIDPIEVTSFGQPDGEYMIVSGHRRRQAGTKAGIKVFPCIVKSFTSKYDVENYVLLANSQRDSAKDPLLFCKRYKMHEEYLKSTYYGGNIREEIAKRLGISVQQADRYNSMNKVILPVWELVRQEAVSMSAVLPMASHSEEEQAEIFDLLCESLQKGKNLTREYVKRIIDNYREAKIERPHREDGKENVIDDEPTKTVNDVKEKTNVYENNSADDSDDVSSEEQEETLSVKEEVSNDFKSDEETPKTEEPRPHGEDEKKYDVEALYELTSKIEQNISSLKYLYDTAVQRGVNKEIKALIEEKIKNILS